MAHALKSAMALAALLTLGIVTGCQKPTTKLTEAEPQPNPESVKTFEGCPWTKVAIKGFSVYAFQCPKDRGGGIHLVGDETLPGFV